MTDDQIITAALEILESRIRKPEAIIDEPAAVTRYLTIRLSDLEHEVFGVMFLTSRHGVIEYREMFRGTVDGASVYPREVVKAALACNAAAVIFAHNHPSGFASPSAADEQITRRLKAALALVDIRVVDHVIIAGTSSYSFAAHGLL